MTRLLSAIATAGIILGLGFLGAGAANAVPAAGANATASSSAAGFNTNGRRFAIGTDRYSTDNGGLAYQRR